LTNNGTGIRIDWGLGVGSTFSGTAGSWSSSNLISATGAVSVVGTGSATFYITGVQLEKGTQATSFDYRAYGTEFELCQRYYEYVDQRALGLWASATTARVFPKFQVKKRAAPTITLRSGSIYAEQIGIAATTATSPTLAVTSSYTDGVDADVGGFSGRSYGQWAFIDPCIIASAEL
jgi:hypothetical protein